MIASHYKRSTESRGIQNKNTCKENPSLGMEIIQDLPKQEKMVGENRGGFYFYFFFSYLDVDNSNQIPLSDWELWSVSRLLYLELRCDA